MRNQLPPPRQSHAGRIVRIAWTIASIVAVETIVCGSASAPVVLLWSSLDAWTAGHLFWRVTTFSVALVPTYVMFALCLMAISAVATRLLGWHTPADAEMPISEMGWPLMMWVRNMAAIHVVRFVAGSLFRGTPIWTAYLRLCGARLGRRVYVNSLHLSDYNLLDFGEGVVIGAGAHVSGHTVEHGVVKTGRVQLGPHVTIGLDSVIEIDVMIGSGCQVGALSFVPKHTRLEAAAIYAGIPVKRIA